MRDSQIEFLSCFGAAADRHYLDYYQDVTHVTAREPFITCRECGCDVPAGNESMKCNNGRSNNEE